MDILKRGIATVATGTITWDGANGGWHVQSGDTSIIYIGADFSAWRVIKQLTPLQFFGLFSAHERQSLAAAALTNAVLFEFHNRAAGASVIDLDAPETVLGLATLVDAGLLSVERQAEIISGLIVALPPGGAA